MNDTNDKTVIIKLDTSYKIKHEKHQMFAKSYFKEVYRQASQSVREIVSAEDYSDTKQPVYTEPISNILTFTGKRGSGKTSAMFSFCGFLKVLGDLKSEDANGIYDELLEVKDRVSFTVLDNIDATLIEKPRDLIGAILGKMLLAIQDKERAHSEISQVRSMGMSQLKRKLGDIYCSLLQETEMKMEDAPSEVLEQLSQSWNQQQAFKKAVYQFNEYMVSDKEKACRNYLVIPIDDIDMNLTEGYQLLEVVRKYLMASNVIVMLAIDYNQLELLCRKTYLSAQIRLNEAEEQARHFAMEYLEKMIPTGRRIYMPKLYQGKFLLGKRVLVEYGNKETGAIRDVILRNMWEHLGIILNKNNTIHWLQPDSLRKLSNYLNSFQYLSDYNESADKAEVFGKNIDWFYEDLINRCISSKRRELYNNEKNIRKKIENFFEAIPEKKNRIFNSMLIDYMYTGQDVSGSVNNSYGVMLEKLYRMYQAEESDVRVNAFSLALSLYMRELMYYMENDSEIMKEEGREKIASFGRNEFWGNYDIYQMQGAGAAQSGDKYIKARELKASPNNSFEGVDYILLSMQLDMYKDDEDRYRGIFRFGNFVNVIFNYRQRIKEIVEAFISVNYSEQDKIKEAEERLLGEFEEWENEFKTTRVIPFDSVELMLDIFEHLYGDMGVLKGGKPEEDYCKVYQEALEVIENILLGYDEFYEESRSKRAKQILPELTRTYVDIYRKCPFIKYMNEETRCTRIILQYISFFKENDKSMWVKEESEPEKVKEPTGQGSSQSGEDEGERNE